MTNVVDVLKAMDEWTELERAALRELERAVYPPEDWADWPGREIEWAGPQWGVGVHDGGKRFRSFTGVLIRDAEVDGRAKRIGGIGAVKTHPESRGRGFASLGMRRAERFFREYGDVAFGLLVCEPTVEEYYARQGWRRFEGRLLVTQQGRVGPFTFNRAMLLDCEQSAPRSGTIDLRGPPW